MIRTRGPQADHNLVTPDPIRDVFSRTHELDDRGEGCDGESPEQDVPERVITLHFAGNRLIGREVIERSGTPDGGRIRLTPRCIQVLALVAEGLTNSEIAGRLYVTPETVKGHVAGLCGMLGAANRAHAVGIGFRRKLLSRSDLVGPSRETELPRSLRFNRGRAGSPASAPETSSLRERT